MRASCQVVAKNNTEKFNLVDISNITQLNIGSIPCFSEEERLAFIQIDNKAVFCSPLKNFFMFFDDVRVSMVVKQRNTQGSIVDVL